MDIGINIKDIITPLLGFIFAILLFIIKHQREKINEKEKQLSEKRYSVYSEVFSIFFDLLKQMKGLEKSDQNRLAIRMIDVKKDLMIYAPDKVVSKFIEWSNMVGDPAYKTKQISKYLELMVEVRKDMGNPKTKIAKDELLRSIVGNAKEFEEFKKKIS